MNLRSIFNMSKNSIGLLSGLASLVLAMPAVSALDVGTGAKPDKLILGPAGPVPVYVSAEGAEVLDAPKAKSNILRQAKFLEPYYLAKGPIKGDGGEYVLAATADENLQLKDLIGWINTKDCFMTREATRTNHGIYRKALIVNDWKRLKAIKDKAEIRGASVMNGPGKKLDGASYDTLSEIGLYDFYYIYDEQTRDKKTFFLLGDRPIIVSHRQPQEAIRGWVSDGRIFRWDTRQAIEFNKENVKVRTEGMKDEDKGVKIFSNETELQWWTRGIKTPPGAKDPLQPVAEEDISVTFWRHNWQRFPLLASNESKGSRAGRLLQIGFIGDQIYLDDDKKGLSATELSEAKEKLAVLERKLRNVDLLFVIDSTGSMTRYFPAAAKAVRAIVNQLSKSYDPDDPNRPVVQFSILFYRDYVDQDGQPNPVDSYLVKRLPLTTDVDKVVKFLTEEPRPPDGAGGDEPEAVFHGIYRAVHDAKEEMTDLSFRAVVLIGDKGNHPEDPKGYNVVDIATFIKENQMDFYSVHVVDDKRIERDPDVRLFQDQVQIINLQLGMERNTSYYRNMDPRQVAKYIVEAGSRVTEDSKVLAEMVRRTAEGGRGGGLAELKKQYGLRLTEKFTAMMRKAGVDPDAFVSDSIQVFGEGWVSENEPKSGQPQVKEVVLVGRADYEILVGLLAGFTRKPPSKENVRKLWTAVLMTNLGEENVDVTKSIAELIQNQLGLVVRKKLLHKSIEEISNLPPTELTALYNELQADLRRMRGVLMEQDLSVTTEMTTRPDGTQREDIVVKSLGFKKFWWQANDQEFAWIPLALLP